MISVSGLAKYYASASGEVQAVRDANFSIRSGEFYTLLGPSGCGKTTTLQCIAGLETPDHGVITMDEEVVFSDAARINRPAHRRNLGMVFQSYAIWPHMSVFDNVAFPLVYGHGRGKVKDVKDRVLRALAMVRLEKFADRPAPFLSGGQQQRVALARALVHEPRLLLFDEPLSNLDAKLREEMRTEIRSLTRSLGLTSLYVTHDQVEALAMSDRIAVMRDGVVVQEGSPRDIYLSPVDAFTADFIGASNIISGRVAELLADGMGVVGSRIGAILVQLPVEARVGTEVQVVVRPEVFRLFQMSGSEAALDRNIFLATTVQVSFVGETLDANLRIGDQVLRAKLDPYLRLAPGDVVTVEIPADRCIAIQAEGASA